MATSLLKIYKNCKIVPNKNFKVEDIGQYLSDLTGTITIEDFQYIKQDLSVDIRVDTASISSSLEAPDYLDFFNTNCYNYISIKNTDEDYPTYYFVVDRKWTANKTVRLSLAMDSINTFDVGTDYAFNAKTKVVREHKDRFYNSYVSDSGDINRFYRRKIDFNSEGIDAVKYKTNDNSLFEEDFNQDWYLMFKSDHGAPTQEADINEIHPCKLYVIPETEIKVLRQTPAGKTISSISNGYYFMGTDFNNSFDNQTITVGGQTFQFKRNMFILKQANGLFLQEVLNEKLGSGALKPVKLAYQESGEITYSGKLEPYYKNSINLLVDYDAFADTNKIGSTPQDWPIVTSSTLTVNGLDSVDRTDVTIQKIIKLPYCPFEIQYDRGFHPDSVVMPGYIDTETITWYGGVNKTYFRVEPKYTGTLINNLNLENSTPFINTLFQYVQPTDLNPDATRNDQWESKLQHSDFRYDKFVYDSFAYPLNNEEISYNQLVRMQPEDNYNIDMITSKTGSGNFMFRFNNRDVLGKTTEDFQNILLVNRNNEIPIYNDSYINYVKNGLNYDKKQKNWAIFQGALGIGSGLISTAVGGLSLGNTVKQGIAYNKALNINTPGVPRIFDYTTDSWTVEPHYKASLGERPRVGLDTLYAGSQLASGIAGIASSITSILQAEQTFEQKQKEMQACSATIASSDDVDLMSEYSGNRAHIMTYECSQRMKESLADLFYYCGYSTDEQKVPNLSTRKNFNYIQCEAILDNKKNLPEPIIDDLKNRYSIGVTVLHHLTGAVNTHWDFEQVTGNNETWLNAW